MSRKRISRALISVTNKDGVIELAEALVRSGVEIIASDGTAAHLNSAGITVKTISQVTGFPEILEGRVKTLHPLIHAAILADTENPSHRADLASHAITPIDLVIVNLYEPSFFDIGGPALIRAAAKNHKHVLVITDPTQYPWLMHEMSHGFDESQRRGSARRAIELTARYDLGILREMSDLLRYGENPHQRGWVAGSGELASSIPLQGKAMSYNNFLDADVALKSIAPFESPVAVIIKHGIPSGIAQSSRINEAFASALASDQLSAFGGVLAVNREFDETLALQVTKYFFEVIVAPRFTDGARRVLIEKKNLRLLEVAPTQSSTPHVREIAGGFLFQDPDTDTLESDSPTHWRLVAGKAAPNELINDLAFSWRAIRSIRSNAILIAKDCASIGIGAGQVSRVDAARHAIDRAGARARGAVAASDAFFPFADGIRELAAAGISAIVQPGGSLRDGEVIEAAEAAGMTMYFTGDRHFSH